MEKVTKILWLIPLLVVSVSSLKPPPGSNITNIHEGLHCWDVSTYLPPTYEWIWREKCHTEFPKQKIRKAKQVCVDYHTVKCEAVGYTECRMDDVKTEYNITMMMKQDFTVKICKPENVTHWHVKKVPHCEPVTKQQCITNWVLDDNGNKVWTNNEECKNVTWNECHLINKTVPYHTTHENCNVTRPEPYWDCLKMKNETITYKMTCTPKAALKCEPVKDTLCTRVEWDDSFQIADENCIPKRVRVPHQERKHRKQCILPSAAAQLDPGVLQGVNPFDSVKDENLTLGKRKRRNARKSFHDLKKSIGSYGSKDSSYAPEE